MSKQQIEKTKVLSLKGHMEELAVKDVAIQNIKDGIEEEFFKAKGLIDTLCHVYVYETGQEMNCSDTSCLLTLASERMDNLMEKIDTLFGKVK